MMAEKLGIVIGVDTHKHTHTAAAVTTTGAVVDRETRRAGAKSDDIDAVRAARQALAGIGVAEPRSGDREAIRVLVATQPWSSVPGRSARCTRS